MKKQKFKKKAVYRLFQNKSVSEIIVKLKELEKNGFGDCKILLYPKIWRGYSTGGVECKLLIPIEEIEIK